VVLAAQACAAASHTSEAPSGCLVGRDYEEAALGGMVVCHTDMKMILKDCGIHLYLELLDYKHYTPEDSDRDMDMAQQHSGERRNEETKEFGDQTATTLNCAAPY